LDQRAACVEAINVYHGEHGPLRLVVCSRIADYESLAVHLRLQGAVVIQPLAMDQIDAALAQAGDRLDGVRTAIRDDVVLQELAETPLLLSIMILAYRGRDSQALAAFDTLDARRDHLFAAYVDAMFQRRGTDARYSWEQTLCWLAWLARSMTQHNQTVFCLEYLQPTWLASRRQRRRYAAGVIVMSGLILGLIGGLVLGLGLGLGYGLGTGFLLYGGLTCLQHLVLRLLLWRTGAAPWNYARFLDYAADRILLRKVGGGYIFVHRMLMEYFASLEPDSGTKAEDRAMSDGLLSSTRGKTDAP
jgi:hypothetical protein